MIIFYSLKNFIYQLCFWCKNSDKFINFWKFLTNLPPLKDEMGTPILFTPLRTFKTGYEAREETLNWWVENENQVMLWNRVTGTAAAALTARALKFPVSPWDIGLPARNSLTRVGRRVWGVNPFREIRGTHTLPSKELFVFYSLVSWHVPIYSRAVWLGSIWGGFRQKILVLRHYQKVHTSKRKYYA